MSQTRPNGAGQSSEKNASVRTGERDQSIVVFSGTTDRGLPPGVAERLGVGTVDYMAGKPGLHRHGSWVDGARRSSARVASVPTVR